MIENVEERIRRAVAEKTGASDEEILIEEVTKENGVCFTAITKPESDERSGIKKKLCYIDGYVGDVRDGLMTCDEAADEIATKLDGMPENVRILANKIACMSKNEFLERITVKLLNAERNEWVARDYIVHDFMDLIAIFVFDNGDGVVVKVSKKLAAIYECTSEELLQAAVRNIEKYLMITPLYMASMYMFTHFDIEERKEVELPVVLTKDGMEYGASVMLCSRVMEKIAEEADTDLYILPSSIHEVIVMEKENEELPGYRELVQEANKTVVQKKDVLSDSVYEYIRETKTLRVAK